jgi:hypothetical protein
MGTGEGVDLPSDNLNDSVRLIQLRLGYHLAGEGQHVSDRGPTSLRHLLPLLS